MAPSNVATIHPPPSPATHRSLRRFQSAQNLGSSDTRNNLQSSLISQSRQQQQQQITQDSSPVRKDQALPSNQQTSSSHHRGRSNSDAAVVSVTSAGPARRRQALGKRIVAADAISVERLIRDGPSDNDLAGALENIRLKILDQGIKSDGDGMVDSQLRQAKHYANANALKSSLRIYIWLILLNAPLLKTDVYLSLIQRGASPAYSKIRNDTFRTLATDPLFRRRVSEASLIRLLNAVAWKLHDAKEDRVESIKSGDKFTHIGNVNGSPEFHSTTPVMQSRARALTLTTEGSDTGAAEPGTYVQGMNVLAAPFLYAARSEAEAFVAFHRFITHECPGYVRGAMDGVHKGLALVEKVLAIVDPKLSQYLIGKGMHAKLYAFPSVLTLCACTPPLPEVLCLWDFLFAYGAHLNILCIVAQLVMLRQSILTSPRSVQLLGFCRMC